MRIRTFESRAFIGLVLLITLLFLWMVRRFLMPVFWAAVFAILFQSLYWNLVERFRGRRSLAALVATLTVVLVVLIPFALLVFAMAQQALGLYARIRSGAVDLHAPIDFAERSAPRITEILTRYGIEVERLRATIESAAVVATQYIGGQAVAVGQNTLTVTILFALMLYFLFFFFRDGDRIVEGVIRALPLGDERERRLFGRFALVSRATVKGTLVVAAVQGALGGIMFWIVGIQAAVFWAVIMGILSLLPAVGPALVWAPAAVILFATGAIWQGVVVVLGGTLVIGVVDNLLRPVLVGRQTMMPDYLVLLATLGGLSVFGLAGFVVGPIIAALFLVVWEMFAEEYAPLDSSAPPVADGPSGGSAHQLQIPRSPGNDTAPEDGPLSS
jgi:predicted PurR-regulated permease PerM